MIHSLCNTAKYFNIDSNTIRNKIVKNVPMTITKQQKYIYARL